MPPYCFVFPPFTASQLLIFSLFVLLSLLYNHSTIFGGLKSTHLSSQFSWLQGPHSSLAPVLRVSQARNPAVHCARRSHLRLHGRRTHLQAHVVTGNTEFLGGCWTDGTFLAGGQLETTFFVGWASPCDSPQHRSLLLQSQGGAGLRGGLAVPPHVM